jgi:DNA-binding NtrC family response regulator
MRDLLGMLETASPSDANILLSGESGTGKDPVAQAVRDASNREDRPFIVVSFAAIPEALLESELFGHERGVFTGAVRRHIGKFERADGNRTEAARILGARARRSRISGGNRMKHKTVDRQKYDIRRSEKANTVKNFDIS